MYHVLLLDDDTRILSLLDRFLTKNGYLVTTSDNPITAKEYLAYFAFDVVVLDVTMPLMSGVEFAKYIKLNYHSIPMIMLTALHDIKNKILGFESGINDYMTKPFEPKELDLRIKNLISIYESKKLTNEVIYFAGSSYNLRTKELVFTNQISSLNNSEYKLLDFLICNKSRDISRKEIAEYLSISERSVDVQINRLRTKIEFDQKNPRFIKTVKNGYILHV